MKTIYIFCFVFLLTIKSAAASTGINNNYSVESDKNLNLYQKALNEGDYGLYKKTVQDLLLNTTTPIVDYLREQLLLFPVGKQNFYTDVLIAMLKSHHPKAVEFVFNAIIGGKMDSYTIKKIMQHLELHTSEKINDFALDAILTKRISDTVLEQRFLSLLARQKDDRMIPLVKEMLIKDRDDKMMLSSFALNIWEQTGDLTMLDSMLQLLSEEKLSHSDRAKIASAVLKTKEEKTIAPVVSFFNQAYLTDKEYEKIIKAFSHVKSDAAAKFLIDGFKNKRWSAGALFKAASESISAIGGEKSLEFFAYGLQKPYLELSYERGLKNINAIGIEDKLYALCITRGVKLVIKKSAAYALVKMKDPVETRRLANASINSKIDLMSRNVILNAMAPIQDEESINIIKEYFITHDVDSFLKVPMQRIALKTKDERLTKDFFNFIDTHIDSEWLAQEQLSFDGIKASNGLKTNPLLLQRMNLFALQDELVDAIDFLRKSGDSKAKEVLKNILANKNVKNKMVRNFTYLALAQLGDKEAFDEVLLLSRLTYKDKRIQQAIFEVLVTSSDERVIPTLIEILISENEEIFKKSKAANALIQIGTDTVFIETSKAFKNNKNSVLAQRSLAYILLRISPDKAEDILLNSFLDDNYIKFQFHLQNLFRLLATPQISSKVIDMYKNKHGSLKRAAIIALFDLLAVHGDLEAFKLLKNEQSKDFFINQKLYIAIASLIPSAASNQLSDIMISTNKDIAVQNKYDKDLAMLHKMLEDESVENSIKKYIVLALRNLDITKTNEMLKKESKNKKLSSLLRKFINNKALNREFFRNTTLFII